MAGETVTVIKAGYVTDPFSGEETEESWEAATETIVEDCIVEPLQSNEPVEAGRASVVIGYKVHMPFDTDVNEKDRVRLYGQVWNVDGRPFRWTNYYTGKNHRVEVQLTGVVG